MRKGRTVQYDRDTREKVKKFVLARYYRGDHLRNIAEDMAREGLKTPLGELPTERFITNQVYWYTKKSKKANKKPVRKYRKNVFVQNENNGTIEAIKKIIVLPIPADKRIGAIKGIIV